MYKSIKNVKEYIAKASVDIDEALALNYLGNDQNVYRIMKTNYLREYQDFEDKIDKCLQNKDNKKLELLIHKLKGISLYLGSNMLYEFATYLVEQVRVNSFIEEEVILLAKFNQLIYLNILDK